MLKSQSKRHDLLVCWIVDIVAVPKSSKRDFTDITDTDQLVYLHYKQKLILSWYIW